jgi:hypothetical protein
VETESIKCEASDNECSSKLCVDLPRGYDLGESNDLNRRQIRSEKPMIRRDYILRMVEDFMQGLQRMRALKKDQLWTEAVSILDEEFNRLMGAGAQAIVGLSETEIMARVMQGEPTQAIHTKTLMLTTLLSEAGDLSAAQNKMDESRAYHLRGLHLLLYVLAGSEIHDYPDFVPKVEHFAAALKDFQLPIETHALLMQHYERTAEYAKAEDALFNMLNQKLEGRILEFGILFYERLLGQSDANLCAGGLPRPEVESGLSELREKISGLTPSPN